MGSRARPLAIVLASLGLGMMVVCTPVARDASAPTSDHWSAERQIENAINETRRKAGRADLAHSDALARVALGHSRDMAHRHELAHELPGTGGPVDRITAAGIAYRKVAENVAENRGYEDPAERAVQGWLDSPGHRANILDRDVTQTGVGVAYDSEHDTYYFTQLFLQPPPKKHKGG